MIKKILALILALVMLVAFAACEKKDSSDTEFGWGAYDKGVYENKFFEFTIDIPEDYHHLAPQEIVDMNLQPDENGEVTPVYISDIEDLSAEALVHYVYSTKFESTPEGVFNPYINIFSENMSNSENLYNKEDYVDNNLNFTSMLFAGAGVDIEVLPLEKPWFDDRQFAKGTMQINYDQFTMFQEMYALTKNNYILVILIGYSNASEKEELYSMLDSITIK